MLTLTFRSISKIKTKGVFNQDAFIDTEQEMMHRKFRRHTADRFRIDFHSIPELHVRSRVPSDTLRNLWLNHTVAGIVRGRDSFEELNVVHNVREVFDIYKNMVAFSGTAQPYFLSIDDDSDYFKATIEDVYFHHFYKNWPMFIVWNRFIPGQPNRMKMEAVVDNWEASEAKFRGGRIQVCRNTVLNVDVYTEEYPRVLAANFLDMLPGKNYLIRDLVRDLPDGVKLSPEYNNKLGTPLFEIQKSVKSVIYWEYIKHNFDASKFADIDLAMMGLQLKKGTGPTEDDKAMEANSLSKAEEDKMRKLAVMLGKDYEELRKEITDARTLKTQKDANKAKKPAIKK